MKLKYILPTLLIIFMFTSCSEDNNNETPVTNEVEGLKKIQDINNGTHTIELFSESGKFNTGYNNVSIRIKDKATDTYIQDATLRWMPMMQMPTMQHSCPKSGLAKALGKDTVYEGYVIYQMTNMDGSGWSLTIEYTIDGMDYTATDTITVQQNSNQNVTSFMASDGARYVLALVEPNDPFIGINDLTVGLYKMENMRSFPVVENYSLSLDPRMPGMGNHSSPNNTDLIYNNAESMYNADLSLTMTGYWVLNLKLLNPNDTVLYGNDVTEDVEQSALYLELEF